MGNSSLVSYTKLSPNMTAPRNHTIDTISIHCMAGNLSVETCGNVFAPSSRQASSNYGIGSDGRIAMYVEEKNRSWCTSNASNDHRAITIEVANDGGAPDWHVSDAAMKSLIKLLVDICKRNNIKKLLWKGDKSLIGQIDKQNMTVHRWFAAKACPGDYLYNKHGYIADEVNKQLGGSSEPEKPAKKKSIAAIAKEVIAGKWGNGSDRIARLTAAGYDANKVQKKVNELLGKGSESAKEYKVKVVVAALNVRNGAGTNYKVNTVIRDNGIYTIVETNGDWGKLKSGAGWINLKYTVKC